jgi:hypothetical protein
MSEADSLRARLCEALGAQGRAETESAAAIARNIVLQEKLKEAEAERVPVASWCHEVLSILNAASNKFAKDSQTWQALREEDGDRDSVDVAAAKEALIEDLIEKIRGLPGWMGTEGVPPSHYVLREVADPLAARVRAARDMRVEMLIDFSEDEKALAAYDKATK